MKIYFFRIFFILCCIANVRVANAATDPEKIATYKDWSVYKMNYNGQNTCYISSTPLRKSGNYSNRSGSWLWVTYITRDISEVSVTSGYPFRTGGMVELSIFSKGNLDDLLFKNILSDAKDGACHTGSDEVYYMDLILDKHVWFKDVDLDNSITQKMKKGLYMAVKGISQKGTCSVDIYSLHGFSAAYGHMQNLCGSNHAKRNPRTIN